MRQPCSRRYIYLLEEVGFLLIDDHTNSDSDTSNSYKEYIKSVVLPKLQRKLKLWSIKENSSSDMPI
jgi:hypothetical protein